MLKFTRNTTLIFIGAATFIAALPTSADIAKVILTPEASTDRHMTSPRSLSAANYDVPVCFSAQEENFDGVVSLHKTRHGELIGKSLGAKKAVNKEFLQPFEQDINGEYVSNYKIGVVVKTAFENAESKRTDTIVDYGQTVEFNNIIFNAGDCMKVVNDYLERDIERRRKEEMVQHFAFNDQLFK